MVDADEAMKRAASEVDWLRGHSIRSSGSVLVVAMIKSLESSGLVCVPREATEEMIKAGSCRPYKEEGFRESETDSNTVITWDAMLAAAPRLTGGKR